MGRVGTFAPKSFASCSTGFLVRSWKWHASPSRCSCETRATPPYVFTNSTTRIGGRHKAGSWSVSVTLKYRAVYVVVDDANVWYWIGTHNAYETFTGKK